MNRRNEKGVALILALILLLIMSVMAVSLMFVSQTETWSSLNYRLMSQARDGAEAGINAAANYIINSYTPPAGTGADVLSSYNSGVSPVQYPSSNSSGHDVILATSSNSQSSNYPVAAVVTAFGNNAQGSLAAGNATINYNTYAKLLSQQQVVQFNPSGGTSTPTTVQVWQITSDGTIGGVRAADEEVSAILEKQVTPVFTYAAFATANGCGAMNFGGGATTDSYNSTSALVSGSPVISASGGNVGTNGNLAENGNPTTIDGTLSTPRTGVGTCTSGNVTAWTDTSGHVTGGLVELPQQVTYPTPAVPNPAPPTPTSTPSQALTLHNSSSDCNGIAGCTSSGGDIYLAPGTCPPAAPTSPALSGPGVYGDLTVKGTVHLSSGCYNINSLTENGNGNITIDSGPVIVNIAGSGGTGNPPLSTPVDLTGGGLINTTGFSPQMFQLLYAGTGTINLKGGANATGLLYAPNANLSFNSAGGNWYGAVIMGSLTDGGGATINYDTNLQRTAVTVGNWMLDSFTWKKN
jgi:Tfp pilus assembly protein PilX